MNQGRKLVELCERWWDEPSPAAEGLRRAAKDFIGVLGWQSWTKHESPPAIVMETSGADGTRLDFAFLPPGNLDASSAVVGMGLDFAPSARAVTGDCRERGARFVLVTDLGRSYLYDTEQDELLLFADSPALFLREIFDEVTRECVDEGGLHEVRRPPRGGMARQLRDWQQRWIDTLARGEPEVIPIAEQFMDQLVIARFLAEFGPRSGPGSEALACAQVLYSQTPAEGAGTRWMKICTGLYRQLDMGFFQPSGSLMKVTADNGPMFALFSEFGRMSRSKFDVACVLESFNYGEAAEKARVRLVPEPDEDREKALASQTLDSLGEFKLEVDIVEEGYRAIGRWFGELVGVYRRLGVPMKGSQAGEGGGGPDAITRAIEQGLRIYYATPRQLRTARLLLHLYVVDLYRRYGAALGRFPDPGRAFAPRPTLLEKEKRWIYDPPADQASGGNPP